MFLVTRRPSISSTLPNYTSSILACMLLSEPAENRGTIGAARKARLSRRTGGATRNSRPATAAAAAVSSRKKAGARKPSVVMKKKRKRRESSSQKATAKGKGNAKRKGRRGEVLGILGLPVRGGDVDDDDDSDYDSSASLPPSKGIFVDCPLVVGGNPPEFIDDFVSRAEVHM